MRRFVELVLEKRYVEALGLMIRAKELSLVSHTL